MSRCRWICIRASCSSAVHGRPGRVRKKSSESNARLIIKALSDFGFGLSSLTWKDFATTGRVIQLGSPPLRIDIMTAIDGVSFNDAWSRKVESRYGNEKVYFIAKEDLIANKRASGRKQDLLDLENLT